MGTHFVSEEFNNEVQHLGKELESMLILGLWDRTRIVTFLLRKGIALQ